MTGIRDAKEYWIHSVSDAEALLHAVGITEFDRAGYENLPGISENPRHPRARFICDRGAAIERFTHTRLRSEMRFRYPLSAVLLQGFARKAACPFLEKSIDSARMRAASCGAWNPIEFSASMKSI
jgi:hypothetical protein